MPLVTVENRLTLGSWRAGTPTAGLTRVAVFSFDQVEVVEQQDDPAPPDTPPDWLGQVSGFDYDEQTGVFALSTYTAY